MPSIFTKQRRASVDMSNDPLSAHDDSPIRNKRRSMDVGRPPVSGNKFKSLFSSQHKEDVSLEATSKRRGSLSQIFGGGDEEGSGTIRKRLSNASQIFHKSSISTDQAPVSPQSQPPTTPRTNGAAARYEAPIPRSPNPNNQFSSPALFPENFTLSNTASPEGGAGRGSWQASYPTVLPEDAYADLAPDGHPATDRLVPSSPIMPSENQFRRSLNGNIPTPSPDEQPLRPVTPPKGPAPLLTPPPSATTPHRSLPSDTASDNSVVYPQPEETEAPQLPELDVKSSLGPIIPDPSPVSPTSTNSKGSRRPVLHLVTSGGGPATPAETASSSPLTRTDSPALGTPSSAHPGRSRPDVPLRRTTLIQSPPMPQPIKNLPSMVGWPAFMKDGAAGTPGWGQTSGTKTPGWSGGNAPRTPGWSSLVTSPVSARPPGTPGASGFPFALPQTPVGQNKGKGRETMTEEDLRKARRAMPVMLREPSFVPDNDGGEVGASDEEDEESDPEMEGHGEDDSEPETETEQKAKKPSVPFKNRLRGKDKGKANAGVSALAHSAVQEEDEVTTPPARPSEPTRAPTQAKKSFWSLGTPSIKAPAPWTQFTSSPSATPRPTADSAITPIPDSADGYFTSNPASLSNVGLTKDAEPVLTMSGPQVQGGSGVVSGIAAKAKADRAARARSPGSDAEASDSGSDESAGMSSQDHGASPVPSPGISATMQSKPDAPNRPSFYSQPSRSMVELISGQVKRTAPTTGAPLSTIKSRENAPTRIEMPSKPPTTFGMMTPSEWAKPPPTPAAGRAGFFWQKTKEGREIGMLKRRRSADDLNAPPPKYEPAFPGTFVPRPRDEEGKEKLPKYWCAVHIEGNLSRKMEFSAPGVQSRDRSWKKQYFILRGTSLYVYRFDPHRFPLKVESNVPIPSVTEEESEEYLHVHCPISGERRPSISMASPPSARRGSIPDNSGVRRASVSSTINPMTSANTSRRTSVSSTASPLSVTTTISEKDPALFPNTGARRSSTSSTGSSNHVGTSSIASHFQQNQLVKQYTLQKAESGLAADYVKRKNVVRVRAEGEQFLLQTESAREVVDWIEAFQAATNVALDLDDRPMPKIITLPRRRRRRAPGAAGAAGATDPSATTATAAAAASGDANPPVADTPEGNAAAVAAAERRARERERMLAEDQAGTVTSGA